MDLYLVGFCFHAWLDSHVFTIVREATWAKALISCFASNGPIDLAGDAGWCSTKLGHFPHLTFQRTRKGVVSVLFVRAVNDDTQIERSVV